MKILFLDDDSLRHTVFDSFLRESNSGMLATVRHVYNAQEAIDALDAEYFDFIFLDRDLGEALSGEVVASWIADHLSSGPTIVIHSWHIDRARVMYLTLLGGDHNVVRVPFGTDLKEYIQKEFV